MTAVCRGVSVFREIIDAIDVDSLGLFLVVED